MKKRIGLLTLFGIVALVIAMMGATSVLAAEPIIPSVVLEVAVADEGVAVGSLSLATVEEGAAMAPLLSSTVEGQAIAISMTTRADSNLARVGAAVNTFTVQGSATAVATLLLIGMSLLLLSNGTVGIRSQLLNVKRVGETWIRRTIYRAVPRSHPLFGAG